MFCRYLGSTEVSSAGLLCSTPSRCTWEERASCGEADDRWWWRRGRSSWRDGGKMRLDLLREVLRPCVCWWLELGAGGGGAATTATGAEGVAAAADDVEGWPWRWPYIQLLGSHWAFI